jgi:MFS family permease
VDSYLVVRGCLLMSAGALGDRYGRRGVFQLGLAVFGAGSLLCSLARGAGMLIGFRVLQAVGGCFLVPGSLALVTEAYPEPGSVRGRLRAAPGQTPRVSIRQSVIVRGNNNLTLATLGWRSPICYRCASGSSVSTQALIIPSAERGRSIRILRSALPEHQSAARHDFRAFSGGPHVSSAAPAAPSW